MDGYPEIGDAPFQPRSHDYPKQAFSPFGVSQVVFRRNLVDGLSTLVQVPCFTLTIERFRGTIFRAKIRMGATDFFQACSIRFFGTRIRVDWLSYEPCFVWRFWVIGCRKIFRVQIWYEKHRFFAGSFDFGTKFQNKKA